MKKLRLLLALMLSAPVLAITPLAAAVTANGTGNTTTTTTTKTSDDSADPEKELEKLVEAEKAKTPQADRIKARIATLKIKLTAAETAKFKLKCVAAQATVKVLDTKINNGITARSKAYDELLSHLDKLILKLKDANVATTDLETERTALKTKIDTFKTDLAKYKVALSDAQGLGCLADPTGFKAALEDARTARKTVADDALAVRSYVSDVIKPTLKTIRANLDKTTTTTDTSKTTTDKTKTTTGGTQ